MNCSFISRFSTKQPRAAQTQLKTTAPSTRQYPTQADLDLPAFKKRILSDLNKRGAENRRGLALALPPSPVTDCVFIQFRWTDDEADRYLTDGVLPLDLSDFQDSGNRCISLWLFDASSTGGKLPEVEMDPMPDFETRPAFLAFDMDGGENIALIPSEAVQSESDM
jgi:hypothetical protein